MKWICEPRCLGLACKTVGLQHLKKQFLPHNSLLRTSTKYALGELEKQYIVHMQEDSMQ